MDYTCYLAKVSQIERAGMIPIAITAKIPEWYTGLVYEKLAPTYDILNEYKLFGDRDLYIRRFNSEILSKLNADEVYRELSELSGGKPFCLVCYEKSERFCHRHLVSEWLTSNGYTCKETFLGEKALLNLAND